MASMVICCPSFGGHERAIQSWLETSSYNYPVVILDATTGPEAGFVPKLQRGYKETSTDILLYMHSDVLIHENNWDLRLLEEFKAEDVAVVSFGGSLAHGHPDIYKIPYQLTQLVRSPFLSNLTDAEDHGYRETGSRDIAVFDSFAFAVRRTFLDQIGGWPVNDLPPCHGSDYYLSLMCHRYHQRIRMVGISATHQSGGKGNHYFEWMKETKWKSDEEMHAYVHRWLYDNFRDVFPVTVK